MAAAHSRGPAGAQATGGSPLDLRARVEAERRGTPHLILRRPDGTQQILDLSAAGERVAIGRSGAAEVAIDWDPEVSRVHAQLERLADRWAISDDGLSMNGTYVNHERVWARRSLADGDVIRLGETYVVFRNPGVPTQKTTAPTPNGPAVTITPAQRRVLVALCRPFAGGRIFATPASNNEISEELHLSVDAVKGHVRLLFRAFGVEKVERERRRTALAERAFETGTVKWSDL
jgi:pSer/pThr/pTyr-binding forkhead associated (FHA) protein